MYCLFGKKEDYPPAEECVFFQDRMAFPLCYPFNPDVLGGKSENKKDRNAACCVLVPRQKPGNLLKDKP